MSDDEDADFNAVFREYFEIELPPDWQDVSKTLQEKAGFSSGEK